MSLFLFDEYREYLNDVLDNSPKKGWGLISKWANDINVSQALLSQVVSGIRDLTQEQGFALSRVLNHTENESRYFQLLLQIARAGNTEFKKFLVQQAKEFQKSNRNVSTRFQEAKELTEEQKAVYYSSPLV